jgi:pyruvate kinase
MRRTKIVCTLGPATETPEQIEALASAGMDVARLNFSHGSYEWHAERLATVRALSEARDRPIAILQDLSGPKIRLGEIPGGGVELKEGEIILFTTRPTDLIGSCGVREINLPVPALLAALTPGQQLILGDGLVTLKTLEQRGEDWLCQVMDGGLLTSRKGVSGLGLSVKLSAVSERDLEDARFGIEHGVDWIAVSFVRTGEDVQPIRDLIQSMGAAARIIAKIEKHEAVDHLASILSAVDGVMVARGDLGLEIPLEEVPLVQKRIIRESNAAGLPVITATQMLQSMIQNPYPTRAEVTDIANAIFDGTDAVMLSEETAVGRFAIPSVRMMARIAERTESGLEYERIHQMKLDQPACTVAEAIAQGSLEIAEDLKAQAILCSTTSGSTARLVSQNRPRAPIIGATSSPDTYRQLALSWGVVPVMVPETRHTDTRLADAVNAARDRQLVKPGDTVVIIGGVPVGEPGHTNMIKVEQVAAKA